MATPLDKDLVRETTIKIDGREILLSINADQSISMKLKGMKSGTVSIGIEELYNQLGGQQTATVVSTANLPSSRHSDSVKLSVHDIRHKCNVRGFDYPTMVKIDTVMDEIIDESKK